MEITKVLKPFIRRGFQYFCQYSVYHKHLHPHVSVCYRNTHLHLYRSDVLVIVLQHVGEEGGVVGHAVAPLHMHRLARERSVAHARVQHEESDAEAHLDLHDSRCLSPENSGGSQSHQQHMSYCNLQDKTFT